MRPPRLSREVATFRAVAWLNSFRDAVEDDYPFTRLLKDQKCIRTGREGLRRAQELIESANLEDDEKEVIRFSLRMAERCLQPAPSNIQGFESGIVGEHLRDCDEAIEVALTGLHLLRENDYSQEFADDLVETCQELTVRACKLADHLRNEGLV